MSKHYRGFKQHNSLAVASINFKGSIKALLEIILKLSTERADQSSVTTRARKPSEKEALKRHLQVPSLFPTMMQDSDRDTFGGAMWLHPV